MIAKLLLVSVLVATLAIPIVMARRARKLRRAVVVWLVFCLLWGFACLYVHPRIS